MIIGLFIIIQQLLFLTVSGLYTGLWTHLCISVAVFFLFSFNWTALFNFDRKAYSVSAGCYFEHVISLLYFPHYILFLVVYLPTNRHFSWKSLNLCKHVYRSDTLEIKLFLNKSICFWNQQEKKAKQNCKKGAMKVDLIFFSGNVMLIWYVRCGGAHMYIRELESLGFLAEVIHCACDVLWQCCDYAV